MLVVCHPGEVATFRGKSLCVNLFTSSYKYHFVVNCFFLFVCFADDDIKESSKVPCILHMDSIKGSHSGLKNIIQRFVCIFVNLNIVHLIDLF